MAIARAPFFWRGPVQRKSDPKPAEAALTITNCKIEGDATSATISINFPAIDLRRHDLARLLFECDDAIRALAVPDVKDEPNNPYRVDVVARAWERDYQGLRTRYEELVKRVLATIGAKS